MSVFSLTIVFYLYPCNPVVSVSVCVCMCVCVYVCVCVCVCVFPCIAPQNQVFLCCSFVCLHINETQTPQNTSADTSLKKLIDAMIYIKKFQFLAA